MPNGAMENVCELIKYTQCMCVLCLTTHSHIAFLLPHEHRILVNLGCMGV